MPDTVVGQGSSGVQGLQSGVLEYQAAYQAAYHAALQQQVCRPSYVAYAYRIALVAVLGLLAAAVTAELPAGTRMCVLPITVLLQQPARYTQRR